MLLPVLRQRALPLLALIGLLPCNRSAAQEPSVQWYAAESGASLSNQVAAQPLVLGPGEVLELSLRSPLPARSVGLWYLGTVNESYGELFTQEGTSLGIHPVLHDHDQAAELVGSARPAGQAEVSGLLHAYEGFVAELRLILIGPAYLEALAAVWIPPQPVPQFGPLGDRLEQLIGDVYPKPPVYNRASWGAVANTCALQYCAVTHLAVHHSASTADYAVSTWSQAAANVKAIQLYHQITNGWCDIGYNYLISKQGWIFEGRAGGDDVKGAHDGFNCGSMGVCAMGYFHPPYNNAPSSTLLNAYGELFAWKCSQKGLNPLGSAFYAGLGATKPVIYGHRDVSATACPGDGLYAQIGNIKSTVQQKLVSGGGGVLKGVIYNASLGTNARIAGATVALGNGQFVTSDSDGSYEFALAPGTYSIAATAPGFQIASSSETVSSGEIWESLGLVPATASQAVPSHQLMPLGGNLFSASLQGVPGAPAWLAYNGTPEIPAVPIDTWGKLWPELTNVQALFLGYVPANGNLTVTLQAPNTPGLIVHTQGLVTWSGLLRFTNGRALKVP